MGFKRGGSSMLGQTRGQLTIFIIIAIVIVALVFGYLFLSGIISVQGIPPSIQPAYTSFLTCLEEDTLAGISVLESQGGYISAPEFEPGSTYMPFSSQLNFLGNSIPYWYYVSGNNIQKEQVPSRGDMENQLADFVEARIRGCNLRSYYDEGFLINMQEPEADVNIKDNEVDVSLSMTLSLEKENDTALVRNHKVSVNSQLGKLYDSAKTVYDEEQKKLFLENYAVDILRLYAPVDGVEVTCSPLIWNADDIFDDVQEAIEANTFAINVDRDEYFNLDLPVDEEVRFLNSRNWPNSFEVAPAETSVLIASPVGNQPGIGVIGFCYVPYHFVYSIKYPVLVQVQSGEEIFQYPMAVVIQGNNPRESLNATAVSTADPELCLYRNTEVQIITKDIQGNPVDAEISYECFGNKCNIGETEGGELTDLFPQCVNGYVHAQAAGYKNARYLFSTVSEGSITVFLQKAYEKNIVLNVGGKPYDSNAIITFTSDDAASTVVYPEQRTVSLAEGQYEIQVHIYRNSSLNIGATTINKCLDVPRSGVLGIFGLTEERCFDIQVPSQLVSNALAGGGTQKYFVLESELINSDTMEIDAESLPVPNTIDQLQDNYLLFESKGLIIAFR